jgi:FkbM family methyltransferase
MSKSQLGQDLKIVEIYKGKKDGYFVDIGANNGVLISNTFLLEKTYNWRGICVEPIPDVYSQLVNNRSDSICCQAAVYSESNKDVDFDIAMVSSMLSGISSMIDHHIEKVANNKKTISVKTISLNDLLDINKAPSFIEYLSVDTEGSEYEILKTFDFTKYTFGVIDVEHNWVEPKRTQIRNLLLSNGYIFQYQNEFDDSYAHSSIFKKNTYYWERNYDRPITVFISNAGLVRVFSSYWETDTGSLDGNIVTFGRLGTGVIDNGITFNPDNIWHT